MRGVRSDEEGNTYVAKDRLVGKRFHRMSIIKDLRSVIFSFGAVFLVLSIGTYTYYTQYIPFENANVVGGMDTDSMGEWVITSQFETIENTATTSGDVVLIVATPTTTVETIPVATKINPSFYDALEAQKAAKEKAAAEAWAEQIAADALAQQIAKEKAAADLLAAQLEAERLAKEIVAVEKATVVKKSRKSRAS